MNYQVISRGLEKGAAAHCGSSRRAFLFDEDGSDQGTLILRTKNICPTPVGTGGSRMSFLRKKPF
jgi:hypothetical protein